MHCVYFMIALQAILQTDQLQLRVATKLNHISTLSSFGCICIYTNLECIQICYAINDKIQT